MLPAASTKQKTAKQDDFFCLNNQKTKNRLQLELLKEFIDANPQRHVNASSFTYEALKLVFMKMNTAVPSSAAVERAFSIGKDILKPKGSGLSTIHFEMLLFLKPK